MSHHGLVGKEALHSDLVLKRGPFVGWIVVSGGRLGYELGLIVPNDFPYTGV
jgi:hypothetical protein